MTCIYSTDDKVIMYRTSHSQNKSRFRELVDYAQLSGFKKLGIANCYNVRDYADKLAEMLRNEGFEVVSLHCRASGLDGSMICDEMSGPCCDPLSQADYLNEQKTDFNVMVGLCLGHELIFQKHTAKPYTTFLVKDFATQHRTIENLK